MSFVNYLGQLWSQLFAPVIPSFKWPGVLPGKVRWCRRALVLSLQVKPKSPILPGTPWELKLLSIQPQTQHSLYGTTWILAELKRPLVTWLKPTHHFSHVLCAPATVNYLSYCIGHTSSFRLSKQHHLCFLLRSPFPSPFPSLGRQIFICPLRHLKYHFLISTSAAPHPVFLDTPTRQCSIKTLEAQPIKQLCSLPLHIVQIKYY